MASAPPGVLDVEKAERRVWLVRVPPYVAKAWHEAIAAAADLPVDETMGAKLGHVTTEDDGTPKELTIVGPTGAEQLLFMNPNRDTADTSVMSWEAQPDGSLKAPRVDGRVVRRCDAAPALLDGGAMKHEGKQKPSTDKPSAGGPPDKPAKQQLQAAAAKQQQAAAAAASKVKVDAAYLLSTRKRIMAAKPAVQRRVAVLDDDQEMARLAGGTKDAPLYVRNRQAKQAAQRAAAAGVASARAKVKLSRDDLEEQLMALFAQQSHWHFVQIQKTLDQPIGALKEVLNEVGLQQVRGPYKDQWELKPVYREAAAKQRAAAAAAGAAGAAGGGGA